MIVSSDRQYKNLALSLISEDLVKRGWSRPVESRSRIWTFTHPNGRTWITSASTLQYPFITPKLAAFAKDKVRAQQYVARLGFEVPKTLEVDSMSQVCRDFLYGQQQLVVKPVDGFGSRGVTLGVVRPDQLSSALALALQYSPRVLLQRQFMGDEIRLTVVEGVVRSVLMKQTAQVVGDGTSAISELLERENRERANIPSSLLSYPPLSFDMLNIATDRLNDIPADGEVYKVGSSSLVSKGACLYEINATTNSTYKDIAVAIANKLGTPFLVVDLMVHDHAQPARADNYIFLEINTSPALKMYYGARNQISYDIVSDLGSLIDRYYA